MIENLFSVDGPPDVSIRIQSGRIEFVEGGQGKAKVSVRTKDPDFVVEQRGDLIDIYSKNEARWSSSKRADVLLEVPPHTNVTIRCASAPIESHVELGKVEIRSGSGDIELAGAEKAVIKTASGDTSIGRVTKALRFSAASGDLSIRDGVSGSVVASTASGDLHIEETDAVLEINTVSGDAAIDRFLGKSASLKSMSGTINIGIPTGTRVDLDATLLSGRVRLPAGAPEGPSTGRHMSIKVKSVSGDLVVHRLAG